MSSNKPRNRPSPLLVIIDDGRVMRCTVCGSEYRLPLSGAQAEHALKVHEKCRAERAAEKEKP